MRVFILDNIVDYRIKLDKVKIVEPINSVGTRKIRFEYVVYLCGDVNEVSLN